jgi:20S proteasome alpha/beta subunit
VNQIPLLTFSSVGMKGYDVLALASEKRHVVGLDISETVNKLAQKVRMVFLLSILSGSK